MSLMTRMNSMNKNEYELMWIARMNWMKTMNWTNELNDENERNVNEELTRINELNKKLIMKLIEFEWKAESDLREN